MKDQATEADAVGERSDASEAAPSGFLCRSPFEYAHIQANGDVYPCCPSKFGKIIGNLSRQKLDDIWKSEAAESVRASIVDGSYRYCNASACEYLRAAAEHKEALSPPELVAWAKSNGQLDAGPSPRVANFGSDRACNLACSYCRKSVFRPTADDELRTATIDENFFSSTISTTKRIVLLGEGDPFASKYYRDKLTHYEWSKHPQLKIKIQTNGLLLTRDMWATIAPSHQAIDWIWVSVDAATPATYRINRGGEFNRLLANLDFIANLRALQKIERFCLSFVVQTNNFREMPAFVKLGKYLGCDQVEFQRIENWGTYTDEQFRERAVHEDSHRDCAELSQILEDPIFQDPIVWLLKVVPKRADTAPIGVMSWDDCSREVTT